ncbi:MAG: VPLPA-CTERM sorting domain-containing protein, partial [Gammaproteobacteria bacterium]|nr:VPLPA-CTERM sorting domain-containing protein [Gammaproteobacteria bacterium]
ASHADMTRSVSTQNGIEPSWGKLRGQAWLQCATYDTGSCVSITAVPLPATAWLLGTALGMLAISRTRRKD